MRRIGRRSAPLVDAGFVSPEFDITEQLMDAVRMIARARVEDRDGQSVIAALRDKLMQGDMFTQRDPDLTEALIGVFYKGDRARGPDASAAILSRYLSEAGIAGRADIDDLFAAEAGLTPTGALRQAITDQDARAPMPARDAPAAQEGPAGPVPDIRGLDAMDTKDGVHSPALTRATDAELRDLRQAPPDHQDNGAFGPIFRDIENDPEAAISRLLSEGKGEVPIAFRHPDPRIGDVAIVYGNEKFGLRHIQMKHPEMVAEIPRLLRQGAIVEDSGGLKRIYLTDDASPPAVMSIRLDWDGEDKTWIVTSFREEQGQVARHLQTSNEPDASVSSRIPDTTGQVQDSAIAPVFQPDEIADAIAQARSALEADPELVLRMGDGAGAQEIRLADLLDDLDQDENLIRGMTSCSLKGTSK